MKCDIIAARASLLRLRPAAGLWDSCIRFRTNLSAQMRPSSLVALILPWLLMAATHISPRAPKTDPAGFTDRTEFTASLCQERSLTALVRVLGGPRPQLLRLGRHPADNDKDGIVQDNAPAARIDGVDRAEPALEPLGTLSRSRYALPSHRILSRRASRGPPVFS